MIRRVQVRETNLKQLVQGEKQFRVPLWQRQYTWRKAEHGLLWRDILEQYARVTADSAASQSGHFLGSIVLSPVPSAASGASWRPGYGIRRCQICRRSLGDSRLQRSARRRERTGTSCSGAGFPLSRRYLPKRL
jgi:Protein of unknown function DUF262